MIVISWIAMILGMGLWTYGYFTTGAAPTFDWGSFSPAWVAEMMPNREAEIGLVLSTLGSIPVTYAQLKQARAGEPEERRSRPRAAD